MNMNFLDKALLHHKWTTLILTALIGGICPTILMYFVQESNKAKTVKKLKAQIASEWLDEGSAFLQHDTAKSSAASLATSLSFRADSHDQVLDEQLSRNIAFLGTQGVQKLKNSFVIVVGLGGVGSHAAHMLLRAGVSHLRLIDFDQVTLSSLNRHAVATRADVGTPKAVCIKKHLLAIQPRAHIEPVVEMFELSTAPLQLSGSPDFVLDCIDHLATKVDLIAYCKLNNIKVISSMGAGAKADPSRIQIADISETFEDALARSTRRVLRTKGIHSGVPVVYSIEKPGQVKLLPLEETKVEEAQEYAALPTFRSRILPVLGTIPALFGNAMASFVLTELAEFPTEPLAIKNRIKTYQKLHAELLKVERDRLKEDFEMTLSVDDVGFIFEEVWRGRSAVSFDIHGKLALVRWDPTKPVSYDNIVVLNRSEAEIHWGLSTFEEVREQYSPQILNYIQSRFVKEALWNASRLE